MAVAVGCTGLALAAYSGDWLRRIELDTVDARFNVRGHERAPNDIVVVAIDDQSFKDLDLRFADWPRSYHERALRALKRAGARVIAYDVQFSEQSSDREGDLALAQAMYDARPVVLAATQTDEQGHTNVLGGERVLEAIDARPANALLPDDPGRVLRRMNYEVGKLKTLAVVTVEVERHKRLAPPRHDRTIWIDYAAPAGAFRTISFSKVMRRQFDPALVRGKTVVVGETSEAGQDIHPTPYDEIAGPEIQANAIATARAGFPLQSAAGGWNIAMIVLLGAIASIASLALRPLTALAVALAAGAAFVVGAQLAFDSGTVVAVTYPLTALAFGVTGAIVVHYLTEVRERNRLRILFGRFVPQAVVDEVVGRADEDLRLGGVELDATVLFSDLRGFTSFSEPLDAPTVIDVLNRYLGEMSEAILDHGGTLVSYMGDGIMAVFGAPIEQADHADRAVAAARDMLNVRLERFNAWLAEEGLGEGFRMGIGLNSGPVMSGNVGSERRLEYTAVGDTTNTASRLEGMTKGTPHQLFIAESVYTRLREPPRDVAAVGDLPIRGRDATIAVWTLAGNDSPPGAPAVLRAMNPAE